MRNDMPEYKPSEIEMHYEWTIIDIDSMDERDKHIYEYLIKCTHTEKRIAEFILQTLIRFSNKEIATSIGCSIKTVTRATTKFHKDGFIIKTYNNRYTPNYYKLNKE
jgi:CRP-like cAMP-binding protein